MQSIIINIVLAALLASPALASAIKGAPTKSSGLKAPVEFSPAIKGRLVQVAAPVAPLQLPVPVPVVSQVVRHSPQPVSVENRDWLIKQEQILQQQHESLDTVQRDLRQSEEQHRLEQNRLIDEQHLLEPAQPLAAPTKSAELAFVRPARLESGKTSQAKLEEPSAIKGGAPIKQEREEQKQEPLIQEQQIEQQQIEQQPIYQKQEGAEAEPYSFAYNIDGQSRGESGDKRGVVRGYYRLASGDGQDRLVEYIADHQGFRAVVKTNEFGTEARSPAHVALHSSQPLAEELVRSSGLVQEQTKQRLAPVVPVVQSPIVQSPVPLEHAPIPLPVQPRPPVVVVQAPPVPLVREESKSPVEQSPRQEHELDDQVQLVRSNTEQRSGKSLEVVRSTPLERTFSSATAHRSPTVQASPVSHRSPKAEVARYSTFKANSYNSDDSPNAGFEHPLDN